jgi:hypothetical protein
MDCADMGAWPREVAGALEVEGGIPGILFGSGGRPRLPQQGEKYGEWEQDFRSAPKAPGGGARPKGVLRFFGVTMPPQNAPGRVLRGLH